jgi:radical SAM superfamily enzyme YgiQ (UPF0313 family)
MHHTAKRGVMMDVFCMTGFPTETFEEAKETVDFLNEFDGICFAYLNILNVFPGTEIYDQVAEMESMGGVEAFSTGYQGTGIGQPHLDVTRNYFLTKFMMRKKRVQKALSIQRNYLTESEILSKYQAYCGKRFTLESADDVEKRLAVY